MDYDTFLSHFGTFGWFNVVLLLVACLGGAGTMSMNGILINFIGTRTDHWCFVPELANRSMEDQMRLGIPWDSGAYATCSMYALPLADRDSDVNVTWAPDAPPEVACQYGMSYDTSIRTSTYISEWDLVCGDAWITDFVSPLFIMGQFIGGLLCGSVSNKLGRKRSLVLILICNVIAGALAAISVNFYMFVVARFLVAACGVNTLSLGYVLALEITPTQYREVASIICAAMFDVGILLACMLAYFITEWRALQLAAAIFCVPCLLLILTIVPESPRWLTWKNRRQEAAEALARIARFNRTIPSAQALEEFYANKKSDDTPEQGPTNNGTYREIFVNPVTRRCALTISFSWISSTFMFSAVSYNVDKLFGGIYVNASVLALVSIGAILVTALAIHYSGRRISLMATFVGAIVLGTIGAVGETMAGWDQVVTACAICIRALGAAGNTVGYVVILELFPTPIRNLVLSVATGMSYGGAMAAPFVAGTLTEFWRPAPYVIYISMSVIAIALVTWLPECRGQPMPETIAELEALKSPKKDQFHQNLQTSVETVSNLKEKGQDNLAFTGSLDYPIDVPVGHLDDGTVKMSPPDGDICISAHPDGVFIVDELLHDDKGLEAYLPKRPQGHPDLPAARPPMSIPQARTERSFSLPAVPSYLRRHALPRPSIIADGSYDLTIPMYLSLLEKVFVKDVEHDMYVTKL